MHIDRPQTAPERHGGGKEDPALPLLSEDPQKNQLEERTADHLYILHLHLLIKLHHYTN